VVQQARDSARNIIHPLENWYHPKATSGLASVQSILLTLIRLLAFNGYLIQSA
jgi:hypothetical protein